jgi:hypothetical protein
MQRLFLKAQLRCEKYTLQLPEKYKQSFDVATCLHVIIIVSTYTVIDRTICLDVDVVFYDQWND